VRTERQRLERLIADHPKAKILLEASTISEWVAQWADRIARRRGMRVAVVALARRLAGILYAMWRDGSAYDPAKLGGTQGTSATLAA
jgi:hypothetical protein